MPAACPPARSRRRRPRHREPRAGTASWTCSSHLGGGLQPAPHHHYERHPPDPTPWRLDIPHPGRPAGPADPTGHAETGTVLRSRTMRELAAAAGPPVGAAVIGNVFIGGDSLRWFRELRKPRMQLPLPAFLAAGAVYYLQLGWVLHRAHLNDDRGVCVAVHCWCSPATSCGTRR